MDKDKKISYSHSWDENIKLNSGFISIDFDKKILFSTGIQDSLGNNIEQPVFMENFFKNFNVHKYLKLIGIEWVSFYNLDYKIYMSHFESLVKLEKF